MIDLKFYETKLAADLKTIEQELSTIANYDEATDNWEAIPDTSELSEADINNEADGIETWNERRSTVSALEIEYRDIKRAQKKLVAGTFGICEISGSPIEEKRLAAKATARTCIAHMNEESQLSI